ncbi:zinc ribbon domain-containing protein [Paucilactobacillus vaccinostercus]|nr:zinc ribbon domain-containing protein [Paucilactobacillus vaccinostercus]
MVNPDKTSQICANCGYDDGYHMLNIRQWTCPTVRLSMIAILVRR